VVNAGVMTHHLTGVIISGPLMWLRFIAAMMTFHQAGVNPWPTMSADVRTGGRRRARCAAMMIHHQAGVTLVGPPATRADVDQSGALAGVNATVTVTVIVTMIVIVTVFVTVTVPATVHVTVIEIVTVTVTVSARSARTTRTAVTVAVTVMLRTNVEAGGAVDHTTSVTRPRSGVAHARSAALLVSVIGPRPAAVVVVRLRRRRRRPHHRRPRHRRRRHHHQSLLS
jgi:hypothetical protein